MKLFVLIVASFAVCSANVIDPNAGYKKGDRYIFFPDGDGIPQLVDLQAEIDADVLNSAAARNPDDNEYWLFTRQNPIEAQILTIWDNASVINSNFNPDWPVVVIAHGWSSSGNSEINTLITEAFLQRSDFNVVVLDWRRVSNRNYVTAKNGVAAIGRGLGQFLNFLTSAGSSFDRMHLVGFSLGAHLVGNAAAEASGEIARVTGLDPAGPLWDNDDDKIQSWRARYVEIVHTSSVLGLNDILGDVDFWPNGGSNMPGCLTSSCSHSRAYEYFAASIKYNHIFGNECDSQRDAERDRCTGPLFEMGNGDYDKTGSGIYRVNTGRSYPY